MATYGATEMASGVNFSTEHALAVAISATDQIYAVGKVDSPYPGATGAPGGAILLQIDPDTGSAVWARTFGTGSFTDIALSADTVYVAVELPAGATIDLGAAGAFTATPSAQALVIALSPIDGTPRAAHALVGSSSTRVMSLSLDGDGVLLAQSNYSHSPSYGTSFNGGQIVHSDAALTTVALLATTADTPESAARTSGGELLVAGSMRAPTGEYQALFSVFNTSGRARVMRVGGTGVGGVSMNAAVSPTDQRVYLFGGYDQDFVSETLGSRGFPGPSSGSDGYLFQMTFDL